MFQPPSLASLPPGESLTERTYEVLRNAILRNQFPPGTALSVPRLARELDVSRTPVREAVQRLIYEGLATHESHRGAQVNVVDIEDLRQLYLVRELLEGLAARLATERLGADDLVELRRILSDHEDVLAVDGDNSAHIELDMRFHRKLRDIAANAHLTATLEPIAGRSHLALHSLWRTDDAPRLALKEHERIVDAMVTGDPELAEEAARQHVSRLRVRLAQSTPRAQGSAQIAAANGKAGGAHG
ncbi:DNA-binding GntR family transcriptional regulator [Murinocardiopsis flavida]|uniref:DNA-binding GntR family transcriptional regulator n=2 Tax=Murinocardiopsis flavida TaxID=645275 RepID=A0A2P8DKV9_9ACTN|nr:DNA-binding GntR family transcriptional regulator [Murinocardiopsis flavida]